LLNDLPLKINAIISNTITTKAQYGINPAIIANIVPKAAPAIKPAMPKNGIKIIAGINIKIVAKNMFITLGVKLNVKLLVGVGGGGVLLIPPPPPPCDILLKLFK